MSEARDYHSYELGDSAMTDLAERVARVETWKEGHEDQCKERYQDIRSDTTEIKGTLASIAVDLKGSVERIHARIDGQDRKVVGVKLWVLTGLVTILLAVVADFAVYGAPWQHHNGIEQRP